MRTTIRLLSFANRFRALVLGHRIERDLDEEIAFHLESKVRELVAEGIAEAEARMVARRAFGNVTLAAEDSRAAWRYAFLDSILQDVRYGARALRRTPAFTFAVTLTLALGIGANMAVFTLIDRVLLRSLAVGDPDALVTLGSRIDAGTIQSDGPPERDTNLFSHPLYRDVDGLLLAHTLARGEEVSGHLLRPGSGDDGPGFQQAVGQGLVNDYVEWWSTATSHFAGDLRGTSGWAPCLLPPRLSLDDGLQS